MAGVTQWQIVASCQRISETFPLPVLSELLAGFPFAIRGVHSDNGSEYVYRDVARLLELQSRSGAPNGKSGRNGRASSTARAKDGRASSRAR